MTANFEAQRQITNQLQEIPLHATAIYDPNQEVQGFHFRGLVGSEFKELNFTVEKKEDTQKIINELQAHLKMPPIWKVKRPKHQKAAWASGYIQAKKFYLSKKEKFHSVKAPLSLPNPYSEPVERAAFEQGAEEYRLMVLAQITLEPYF